jgi:hypothetical protein
MNKHRIIVSIYSKIKFIPKSLLRKNLFNFREDFISLESSLINNFMIISINFVVRPLLNTLFNTSFSNKWKSLEVNDIFFILF